jgi:aarF domain-containing kinase
MAGKRLLDAAKLAETGTSIAKQHLRIRKQQWDVYSQTSSLAKAVKSQTDRVTVTAGAAIELAKRLNETGPSWTLQQQAVTREEDAKGWQSQGAEQVHSVQVGRSEVDSEHDVARTVNKDQREEVQEQTGLPNSEYLSQQQSAPEGRTAPAPQLVVKDKHDDGTLSSLRKRELQRQAERQIPIATADGENAMQQASGQDTFNERAEHVSPELSLSPKFEIPKHADEAPDPQEVMSDGINTDIYNSPRVASMLGHGPPKMKNPYANRQKLPPQPLPEMIAAREKWNKEQVDTQAQPEPRLASQVDKGEEADAETQELVSSIADAAVVG